jgi:branched-chain amino acid transport system ATP-binding protein
MHSPVLAATNLNTFYGPSHILRDVSFHIGARETVSLLGRNGMGKTTLLRTLMGLVRPRSGAILLHGQDVTASRPNAMARAGLGFVPENRGIFPNLTVEENLIFAQRAGRSGRRDWQREKIYALFPRLAERRKNWGNQLSGGEQQMLTIGRALMARPRLLLLDEPSLGLAPLIARQIFQTVAEIRRQGVTVLLVEQNVHLAFTVADRAYVMETGRVRLQGTPAELSQDEAVVRTYLGG